MGELQRRGKENSTRRVHQILETKIIRLQPSDL